MRTDVPHELPTAPRISRALSSVVLWPGNGIDRVPSFRRTVAPKSVDGIKHLDISPAASYGMPLRRKQATKQAHVGSLEERPLQLGITSCWHFEQLERLELAPLTDEEFRLPLSSYDELVKIIRSYGHIDGEVPLPEIAKLAGLHTTIVSRNNAFLVAMGIVEAGQRKVITPLGKGLARALEHNIIDEVAKHWREVIAGNQFFQRLIAAVRIRRGMDEPTLQAHVAYSAGQKKSPGVMAGSAAIVEIMKVAGVLRDENGKLVARRYVDDDRQ
jgi:hypothetical protein